MPDASEIARILSAGEGRQVEFKEGLAEDGRVARTICAFANTRGGVILVGVADRGRPVGIARPAAAASRLLALAATRIEPPVALRAAVVRVGGKAVVWCSVPLSPARPHAVSYEDPGRPPEVLVRVGSSNRAAPAAAASKIAPRATTPGPLDARILAAIASRTPAIGVAACARELRIGRQRARQALERLERAGRLVAHGLGESRLWEIPD